MPSNCVESACVCYQIGYDCDNCVAGCSGTSDCLCIRQASCCACGVKHRGCGLTTQEGTDECCKIGCFCCDFGLIQPTVLCAEATQTCCCYRISNIPCTDYYMKEATCACCFISCAPTGGCCVPAQDSPALLQIRTGELKYPKTQAMSR